MKFKEEPLKKNIGDLLTLFLAAGASAGLALTLQIVIARYSNPTEFGEYSSLIAIIALLSPLCGFGVPQYWLRLWGEHGNASTPILYDTLKFCRFSTIAILALLIIWFLITSHNIVIFTVGILLSTNTLLRLLIDLLTAVLQIQRKYVSVATWQLSQSAIFLVGLGIVISFNSKLFNLVSVALVQSLSNAIIIAASAIVVRRFLLKQRALRVTGSLVAASRTLSSSLQIIIVEAAPFGMVALFYIVYYQLSVVFVRYIEGPMQAGYYSAALLILTGSYLVPTVVYQKFLIPKLHFWAYHNRSLLKLSYGLGFGFMAIMGLLMFIIVWVTAPLIIVKLYSTTYSEAIPLLRLLAVNIPIVYVADNAGSILVTKDNIRYRALYMGISAAFSIIATPLALHLWGTSGAAFVIIAVNAFMLVMYLVHAHRELNNQEIMK